MEADGGECGERMLVSVPFFKYLIYQYEFGESKTLHIQAYMQFASAVSFDKLRGLLPGAHLEPARGRPASNIHYCSKPLTGCVCEHCVTACRVDGPYELGERPNVVVRVQHQSVTAAILAKAKTSSVLEVVEAFPAAIRIMNHIRMYQQMRIPHRSCSPSFYILFGHTRSGKSRYVYARHAAVYSPRQNPNLWFDNYVGQEAILLDDWMLTGPSNIYVYYFLLQLCDRYPLTMPMKGVYGGCVVNSPFVYVTNNVDPRYWFDGIDTSALAARCTGVALVKKGVDVRFSEGCDAFNPVYKYPEGDYN